MEGLAETAVMLQVTVKDKILGYRNNTNNVQF